MATEENSLWPKSGKIRLSDTELLNFMISRLDLGKEKELTADSIYAAFTEVKKESDYWIKYYLISITLLVMTATGATKEMSLFNAKINGEFIGAASIIFFSVCTVIYTNHELKIRFFRSFFNGRLAAMDGPDRADILLRYPLSFHGGEFVPFEARPKEFTVSWQHIIASLPSLVFLSLGWLLAVYGLLALLFYALYCVYSEPKLPFWIKGVVVASCFGSLIFSGTLLRKASVKHTYESSA